MAWQDSGAKARRENGFALENEAHMKNRYPGGMSYTEWKRTPFRVRHRLVGFAINNMLRYWQSCMNANCRRARACQNFACYWRRLQELSFEDAAQVRKRVEPLAKLLSIGCTKGAEGRPLY
jgi:hypothetical protein